MKIRSAEMLKMYKDCSSMNLTKGQVFLIYRFNDDESKVGGMFAAPYTRERTKLIQGIKPLPVMKLQLKSDKSFKNYRNDGLNGYRLKSALVGYEKADNQGGGHAEEFFLQFFLAKRRLLKIFKVEIMVSRIPCVGISLAWRLPEPQGELPCGCGAKLLEVIKRHPEVNWLIAYEDLGNMQFRDMADINRLANAQSGCMYAMVNGWE